MVRILLLAVISLLVYTNPASAFTNTVLRDSVGVQTKNGKLFVQHKVEPKETLFALSRKYGVPVAVIVESNPTVQTSINIGQIVLIPRNKVISNAVASTAKVIPTAPAASNRTFTVNENGEKLHTVEAKQTLYSIARMHDVTLEAVKQWNNLVTNQVNVGNILVVGKGETTASTKPIYVPEADEEMVKPAEIATETPGTPVASPENEPAAAAQPVVAERAKEETSATVERKLENGMAEMIDPKADTNKYLALHRSAPIGTIMQVKNAMNDRVVYVRVIGKLPETGANDKVLVRISKKAYQSLGAVDQKFRVEVSYLP